MSRRNLVSVAVCPDCGDSTDNVRYTYDRETGLSEVHGPCLACTWFASPVACVDSFGEGLTVGVGLSPILSVATEVDR